MSIPWGLSKRDFITVFCCFMCGFVTTFDIVMVSTNLGAVQDSFDINTSQTMIFSQMLAISYILFFMLSIGLTDRYGKRRALVSGLSILGVSSLMCCIAWDFTSLVIFRIISGLGVSLMQTSCNSIITDTVDNKFLGEAMSFCYSFNSFGAILAPLIAYPLAKEFGINLLFISVIPVCFILVYFLRDIDNVITRPDLRINYPVHIMYMISVSLLISAAFSSDLTLRLVCVIAGLALFLLTIYIHRRSVNKVINAWIFTIRTFTVSIILAFIFSYVNCGIENSLSQFFQLAVLDIEVLGILINTAGLAAVLTSFKPVIQMIASPLIARFYRNRVTKYISLLGFVLMLFSAILALILFYIGKNPWCIVLVFLVYIIHAFAGSLFTPYNKKVMMSSVPKEDRNTASSTSSALGTLASIAGTLTLVNLISDTDSLDSFRLSVTVMFTIVLVVAVIGVIIAAARKNYSDTR